MGRLIIVIAVLVLGYFFWRWFKLEYTNKGRPFAVKTVLVGAALTLLVLAGIGRVHWVGAALASLLAIARFALPIALKGFPIFQKWQQKQQNQKTNMNNPAVNETLSKDEALDILGLGKNPSNDEIIEAHRRLIQKLHPDRGGNDYLAIRVNLAKDILLK